MLGLAIIPNPPLGKYSITIYGKESANYTLQTVWWNNGSLVDKSMVNDSIEEGEIKTIENVIGTSTTPTPIPEFTPIDFSCVIGLLLIVIGFSKRRLN